MLAETRTWEWVLLGMPWQMAAAIAVVGVIVLATFGRGDD